VVLIEGSDKNLVCFLPHCLISKASSWTGPYLSTRHQRQIIHKYLAALWRYCSLWCWIWYCGMYFIYRAIKELLVLGWGVWQFRITWRPSWLWSYGSWIYNHLCNQCLSPLKLWVQTPFMAKCTRYNIMW
jgi:hypothetical protein